MARLAEDRHAQEAATRREAAAAQAIIDAQAAQARAEEKSVDDFLEQLHS